MTSPYSPPAHSSRVEPPPSSPRANTTSAQASPNGVLVGVPPLPAAPAAPPMYWRVLRLSAVRPNGWQRAILVEGVIAIAVILALADVASAWTVVVLPLVSMAIVMAHDYLAGLLDPGRRSAPPPARIGDYAVLVGILIGIVAARLFTHPSSQEGETLGIVLGVLAWSGLSVLAYRYRRRWRALPGRARRSGR
jgi:hypothetical protein